MKCVYQPVGKYLLVERFVERFQEYTTLSVDHGKVIAVDPLGWASWVGKAVAFTKGFSIGGDRYLVHEDDIVAVVTETT